MNPEYVEIRRKAAARGKYAPLHRHLAGLTEDLWRASFSEIEQILGFRLPDSARLYPAWWSNGGSHSHALAWEAAGFRVRPQMPKEVIVFERNGASVETAHLPGPPWFDLDALFAPSDAGPWPEGFTASREQLYDDEGR